MDVLLTAKLKKDMYVLFLEENVLKLTSVEIRSKKIKRLATMEIFPEAMAVILIAELKSVVTQ